LLDTLSRRIVRVLERRGLLIADPAHPSLDLLPDSSLDHLQAASIAYRIAIGPHAGRKALTLYSVPPMEETPNNPLLAQVAGFSLQKAETPTPFPRRFPHLFGLFSFGRAVSYADLHCLVRANSTAGGILLRRTRRPGVSGLIRPYQPVPHEPAGVSASVRP
jgi:hypothetical protein